MPFTTNPILKALSYFGYFGYPLTAMELLAYCGEKLEASSLQETLNEWVHSGRISECNGYYTLGKAKECYEKRLEGERRFQALQERIKKSCARLRYFPFIEFVGLSGSLAKGFAGNNADIDLFIVTTHNRLWICRTLLHLFKKLSFLKGSEHWYCMNYFIDERTMHLEEQNYFTAVELSTLKPLLDRNGTHGRLLSENADWLSRELPNFSTPPLRQTPAATLRNTWSNHITELFASDRLNQKLMHITDKRWRAKWKKRGYPDTDYELAFKTRIYVSKNHRHNYQKKLLETIEERTAGS